MSGEKELAIKVVDLHKSFRLPTERAWGLKQAFFNRLKGIRGFKEQKVLKGISFEIEKGDFVGIVGKNGSGKSTLLKLLAEIYKPEKGKVIVNGSLVPFIELGVGFNPELTGRENIYMNGALLGFSNKEVDQMYDEIVRFAELEEFMDQKLKNYSSGMQVRLAFSIAIRANGDILLLDEVLAVGDEAFQQKCFDYFANLKKRQQTVILVTHSMDSVQTFCNKAIMLEDGKIVESGNPLKVAQRYREANMDQVEEIEPSETQAEQTAEANRLVNAKAKVEVTDTKVILDFSLRRNGELDDPIVAFGIFKDDGAQIYRWASDEKVHGKLALPEQSKLRAEIANEFPDGNYSVLLAIKSRDRSKNYGLFNDIVTFKIRPRNSYPEDKFWKLPEKIEFLEDGKQ